MDLARYLVDAVVSEKRSCREVARAHGVSKSWVAELVARFKHGGYDGVAPRSKAVTRVANRSLAELEDRVVRLRKELADEGLDAGAQTIHYHLSVTDPALAMHIADKEPQAVLLFIKEHEEELLAVGYQPGLCNRHEILRRYQPAYALARPWAACKAKPNSSPKRSSG